MAFVRPKQFLTGGEGHQQIVQPKTTILWMCQSIYYDCEMKDNLEEPEDRHQVVEKSATSSRLSASGLRHLFTSPIVASLGQHSTLPRSNIFGAWTMVMINDVHHVFNHVVYQLMYDLTYN